MADDTRRIQAEFQHWQEISGISNMDGDVGSASVSFGGWNEYCKIFHRIPVMNAHCDFLHEERSKLFAHLLGYLRKSENVLVLYSKDFLLVGSIGALLFHDVLDFNDSVFHELFDVHPIDAVPKFSKFVSGCSSFPWTTNTYLQVDRGNEM